MTDTTGANGNEMPKSRGSAAQKRYRERLKAKKEGMEDQLAVLTRRIAELEATHSSLETRNRSLERFVEISNEKDSRSKECSGQSLNPASVPDVDHTIREWHRLYVQHMNKLRDPEDPQLDPEQSLANFPDPMHFQAIKREACMRLYKVMGYTLDPGEAEKAKVCALMQQLRKSRLELMKHMHLAGKSKLSTGILKYSHSVFPYTMPAALPALTRSMHLGEEQKSKILEARERLGEECGIIRVERERILSSLRQSGQPQLSATTLTTTLSDACDQIHSAQEAQKRFHESLCSEISAMNRFAVAWMEAVTPWQEARVLVEAYIKHDLIIELWDVVNVLEMEAATNRQQNYQHSQLEASNGGPEQTVRF